MMCSRKSTCCPHHIQNKLVEWTTYALYLTYELRMKFYIGILNAFIGMTEKNYNIFKGTQFVSAALVSSCMPFLS